MNRITGMGIAIGIVVIAPSLTLVAGAPPQIVRGPYLQLGTNDGGVVRWRTDVPASSRVTFGVFGGAFYQEVVNPTLTTEHEVALSGLQPATQYSYEVGTADLLLTAPDPYRSFTTAPAAGSRAATRVWVIGDSGTANGNAAAVRDAFEAHAASQRADLWLMLGDNAYGQGTDEQYQAAVFEMYPDLLATTWLWPAFGNHDSISANATTQTGPYFDIFTLPTSAEAGGVASDTEAWYSFDWANVHFVCLDPSGSNLASDGPMLTWLAQDLAATTQDWIISFFHHPPYSHGSHDSDDPLDSGGRLLDMRTYALPLLETAGVDLVLSGHSHSYERSFLLHGHYGTSDTLEPSMILDDGDGSEDGDGAYHKHGGQGSVYTVAGSSGKVTPAPLDHPAMFASLPVLGSVVLDIDGPRLDVAFLSDQGVVLDQFTLLQEVLFADGFESGDVLAWIQ